MKPGIHGSVRRGLAAALEEARAHACPVLQILPYRRHHPPGEEELAEFRAKREELGLESLLIHSRFVPAPASSDDERRRRSVEHLARELALARGLNGDFYVLHAGAYSPGQEAAEGARLFVDSLRRALERSGFEGTLLLENVPGGGRRMGGSLEELAALRDALAPHAPRLGVCLDTAHAYAAGYDLASAEGALKFCARAFRLLGPDAVRAFHLNDTRALLGSHLENHAHWGEGRIGREGLATLLNRDEFSGLPAVLETPKDPGGDERSLAFVRALAAGGESRA